MEGVTYYIQEQEERQQLEATRRRLVDLDRQYGRLGACPECGSSDGMQSYDRAAVRAFWEVMWKWPPPRVFWRLRSDDWPQRTHDLYRPCWHCLDGSDDAVDTNYYEPVLLPDVLRWLRTPCKCGDCEAMRARGML